MNGFWWTCSSMNSFWWTCSSMNSFRWTCSSMNSFRWTCSLMNIVYSNPVKYICLCPVSPRWDIYVWWVLMGIYMSMSCDSLLEYKCQLIPLCKYYVYISSDSYVTWFWWVLVGTFMSGESSLEHICPVSPPWNTYVRWVIYYGEY